MTPSLDEQVARKLGWTDLKWSEPSGLRSELSGKREGSPSFGETVPDYSTDIKAAWEIVEKFPTRFQILRDYRGKWRCGIGNEDRWNCLAEADTAPMAICKAFLKLKNEEVSK